MLLFLILSIPLAFLILNRFFTGGEWNKLLLARSVLKGFMFALAGLILFWLLRFGMDFSYKISRMYYYSLIFNGCISIWVAFLGVFILIYFRKKDFSLFRYREYLLLWGTFFLVISIKDALSLSGQLNFYNLITKPLLNLSLWSMLALISDKMERMESSTKILTFLLTSLVLFFIPFIQLLHYYQKDMIQFIFSLIALGFSIFVLYLEFSKRQTYGRQKIS